MKKRKINNYLIFAISFILISNTIIIATHIINHNIEFSSSSDTNNSHISRNYIIFNISTNKFVNSIKINLYNSNNILIKYLESSINPFYGNFSNLSNGIYLLNSTAMDNDGNVYMSVTRTIIIDNIKPIIYLIYPNYTQIFNSNLPITFHFNISDTSNIANCSLIIAKTTKAIKQTIKKNSINSFKQSFSPGTYIWNIRCIDIALNIGNSDTRIFIVNYSINSTKEIEFIEVNEDEKTEGVIGTLEEEINIEYDINQDQTPTENVKKIGVTDICESNWKCNEWDSCKFFYKIENLIQGNIIIKGEQKRICADKNHCYYNRIEKKLCEQTIPNTIKKVERCYKTYLEVYDDQGNPVSRILLENKGKNKILNLEFSFGNINYCIYCYDGIKNFDEEGVDCGPSCSKCES